MDYVKLSKEVSYALRHAPWEYDLELDEDGWVNVEQLLDSLKTKKDWLNVCAKDLQIIVDISDKKRHEISEGKIRALYGHSTQNRIIKDIKKPPDMLYHGTARNLVSVISKNGLSPKGRQYVHLSVDINIASQVGKRHDDLPAILKIDAKKAWNNGIVFYQGNDKVWLADFIPSEYIDQSVK